MPHCSFSVVLFDRCFGLDKIANQLFRVFFVEVVNACRGEKKKTCDAFLMCRSDVDLEDQE